MKSLLSVAVLQLLLASALSSPEGVPPRVPSGVASGGDYYEDWEPWGPCSRTCGTGVTTRTRRCVTQRADGRGNCVGPAKAYRSCNTQECPVGSRDFREQQCSEFDGMDFEGKRHTWLPYYGAVNPCELNCFPRGENFFFRHRWAVADGTPCYPGRRDVCVEGMCKRLGCDNMLESPRQEDPCLQCGGNGQSCFLVRNVFSTRDLATGYHQVVTIPVGATTIRIREMVATRNYLAIKNSHGEYYLNGHGVTDYTRAIPAAGTMLYYQRRAESDGIPESIVARGPTTEQLVIELVAQEGNLGLEYEYYLPRSSQRVPYMWSYGLWSDCSRECGPGYQSRRVHCSSNKEVVSDHLCADRARPLSNRTCELRACPRTYTFDVGEWSSCSVSCGDGVQSRRVLCISDDGAGRRAVDDSFCTVHASVPPRRQACTLKSCAEYAYSSYRECSVTCGTGEQMRDVFCVAPGGRRLPDHACDSLPRPQHIQTCQRAACPDESFTVDRPERTERPHCGQSYYGCCSDGHTPATGHYGEGCPSDTCARSRYGCCPDGVSAARGPSREGCVENAVYTAAERSPPQPEYRGECHSSTYGCCYDRLTPASGSHGEGCHDPPSNVQQTACYLPSTPGPCSKWVSRYYFDPVSDKCSQFWYGGCHGNSNNFPSRDECQRQCVGTGESRTSAIPVPSLVRDTGKAPVVRQDSRRRPSVYRVKSVTHRRHGSAGHYARG